MGIPLIHSLIFPAEPSKNPNRFFRDPKHHIRGKSRLMGYPAHSSDELYNTYRFGGMVFVPSEKIFHRRQISGLFLFLHEFLLQIPASMFQQLFQSRIHAPR